MIHALIAAVAAALLGFASPWLCLVPAVFFLGREIGQAERRYLLEHKSSYTKAPWYCGFLPESWNKKSLLDCLLPLAVCIAIGGVHALY